MTAQTTTAPLADMRAQMEKATALWREGVDQSLSQYQDQWRQAGALGTAFWGRVLPSDSPQRLVSERLCALGRVSSELAAALPLAPMPGAGSDLLAERYLAVIDANRALMEAFAELLTRWQETQVAITGELITATHQALELQRATFGAMDEATMAMAESAAGAMDTAAALANDAAAPTVTVAEEATAEAEDVVTEAINASGLLIKGNVSRAGEKIYHLPGQANYDRVLADAYFATEADAEAAGYRASRR